jgi:hypothetical protein
LKFNSTPQKTIKDPSTLAASIRRILYLSKKELKVLWHDKLAMILLIAFAPSIIVLATFGGTTGDTGPEGDVIGMATSRFSVPNIGLADFDDSEGFGGEDLSAEFCSIFEAYEDNGDCVLFRGYSRNEMEQMIGKGEINVYVIIEDGFEYNISTHFVTFFTVVMDNFDIFSLSDIISLIDEVVEIFKNRYEFNGAIDIQREVVNLPEKAATLFSMCAYFFPILAFAMPILIQSQILINDVPKDRMVLTPANKREILSSKLIAGSILCSISAIEIALFSILVGLEVKSGFFIFFLIMETCVLTSVAMGMFISSISETSLAGFQFSLLAFLVQEIMILFVSPDSILLSFFPIFSTQELIDRVVLKGENLMAVTNSIGIPFILVMAIEWLVSVVLAAIIFNRRKSVI